MGYIFIKYLLEIMRTSTKEMDLKYYNIHIIITFLD